MAPPDTATPATAICGEPALNFEQLGGELDNHDIPARIDIQGRRLATPIRCELNGSDTAQARGLTASGATGLCRLLIAAGADPNASLECFRNSTLALRVKSIRSGARLTVRETATEGPRFVAWKAFPHRAVTPPVRRNAKGLSSVAVPERATL
jgi:hypothetical protein